MKHSYLLVCSAVFLFGCPMIGEPEGKQKNQRPEYDGSGTGESDSVADSTEEEELPCNNLYDECVTNGVEQDICNDLLAECEYNEQGVSCEDLYEACIADHISHELCGELQDCLSVDNPDEEAAADSSEEEDDDNEGEEEDTEQSSDDNQNNDQPNDNEQDPD